MRSRLVRSATALATLLLPSFLLRPLLNALGHRVCPGARIGFSLLCVDRLYMARGARIGHFNLIILRRVVMRPGSYMGRTNLMSGPLSLWLGRDAALGNGNKVVRGPLGEVTTGPSYLRLGRLSKITSDHRVDCTRSVTLGDYSTVAGVGTMIWTHGYVHDLDGPGRYRIDGAISIGDNVYIGAGCIVSMGVRIISGVMVGAGVTVSRDLLEQGLYVSAPMRMLPRPENPDKRENLERVTDPRLCERVYLKTRR